MIIEYKEYETTNCGKTNKKIATFTRSEDNQVIVDLMVIDCEVILTKEIKDRSKLLGFRRDTKRKLFSNYEEARQSFLRRVRNLKKAGHRTLKIGILKNAKDLKEV